MINEEILSISFCFLVIGMVYCFFKRKSRIIIDPEQAQKNAMRKAFLAIKATADEVGLERFLDIATKMYRYILRETLLCATYDDAINDVCLRFNSPAFRKEVAASLLSLEETQTVNKLCDNLQAAGRKKFV